MGEAQLRPRVREIARQQWEKLKVTKRIRASGQLRPQQDEALELFWQDHFRHEDLLELWKLADSAIYAHGPEGQEARQRVRALGVAINRRGGGGETGHEVMQLYYHAMQLFTLFEYSSVREVNPRELENHPDQGNLLDGIAVGGRTPTFAWGFVMYSTVLECAWHGVGQWQN